VTSKGKTKGQSARGAAARPLLDRLKPGEAAAVLRRLLELHPDLSSEAEEMGIRPVNPSSPIESQS
jgi:hypothetical protein